ncbi:MAG: radical SAM/SPASM domain-containing protein [Bacteroidales bacterium]
MGYFLSRLMRRVIHLGNPVSLSIEPTNCCNLHCPECPSGMNLLTRDRGIMDPAFFQNLIDQVSPTLYYLNLYFQGEPYIHPQFTEMVRVAKSKKIFVSTSTNGHFLTPENAKATLESGLDRLIISLDGIDAETYEKYRKGGNFNEVITGIKEIVNHKQARGSKKPKLILQFLVLKSNQHQIKHIQQLGKDLGVDKVELKTAQFYDFRQGNPLMPDDPRFSRYKKIKTDPEGHIRYEIRNRLPNYCFRMWSSCVVTWDGAVVPCCFDKDAKYRMGNVKEQAFVKIWKNETYCEFRNKILSSRKSIDICINCTE